MPARAEPSVATRRWGRRLAAEAADATNTQPAQAADPLVTPRPAEAAPRLAGGKSFCVQHYHSTGCAGGAFAWRAAKLDPGKGLHLCRERREFRATTVEDIAFSLSDKQHGQGPRVGSFQHDIPGDGWTALPKYDFSTQKRSSAFNERMHVEWENHVDHILANGGELPTASVVAKAGFRSCAPCCRDMLALARPTGKAFIMVDLAEQDGRGTFHFVCGERYLPIPKEHLDSSQVAVLKRLVLDAQAGLYPSSEAIHDAVVGLGVPVDVQAQALYTGDRALLPAGCARELRGDALLQVLHAEHFARLAAEYGASILRDTQQPAAQKRAILACRARAQQMLAAAWAPVLPALRFQLQAYAADACAPLLPDDGTAYALLRRSAKVPQPTSSVPPSPSRPCRPRLWKVAGAGGGAARPTSRRAEPASGCKKEAIRDDDAASSAGASTAAPDDDTFTLVSGDDSGAEDECL